MTDMKKITPVLLLLLIIIGYFFFSSASLRQAPSLALSTLSQQQLHTTERQGKSLLITFWATSCSSCVKEMPHLIELQARLGKQLDIVGVAMFYDEINQVQEMVKRRNLNYSIVYDQNGTIAEAFGGIRLTPTSFLISPQGHIIYQKIGDIDFNQLEKDIASSQQKQG